MLLELKKGVDILSDIGGITSIDKARELFEKKCNEENLLKINRIKNEDALLKIANAASMFQPEDIWLNTGSEADLQTTRDKTIEKGEEFKLKVDGHTCHYDLPEDQARLVKQTYYIVNEDEDVSVLAKKTIRSEAYNYVKDTMVRLMKGRTMTISLWNRGPIGAKAAISAVMITDSYYVVHAGNILYPNVYEHFDEEIRRAGTFFFNVHSYGTYKSEDIPKARIFMDRSWQTSYSMYCTYAGNTLLLKKPNHRFHVDHSTYYRLGKELSEHMFITGLEGPGGRITYFAGAAPSGCGKTTTAMVGDHFIGDDLAQMWIEDDGTLRAVNPEIGIFGILRDVNRDGDPELMKILRADKPAECIYTNVLIEKDGTPRWVGDGDPEPTEGKNYIGHWKAGMNDNSGNPIPYSNPNSRCNVNCKDINNYDKEAANDPAGVPIMVITYSGRDSDTMPPVWVGKTPDHGVVIGASILSAATATEIGVKGIRRQPWANEPFIPGPLADYMNAQFTFFNSNKLSKKPIMAGLNYFLTHGARGGHPDNTELLGEKRDVKAWLSWLERRSHNEVKAIETPIGYIPLYEDLKLIFNETIGKEYLKELYDKQFSFYIDNIIAKIDLQKNAYKKEKDCPERIFEIYDEQLNGLESLKKKYGPIVSPEQLIESCGVK